MAKDDKTVLLERIYTIPLRREFRKVGHWKRTEKAVVAVKEFLQKHMKAKDARLEKSLNDELWKHGIKNPPHKVKVTARKEKDVVRAELFGVQKEVGKEKKKEKKARIEPHVEIKSDVAKAGQEEKKTVKEAASPQE